MATGDSGSHGLAVMRRRAVRNRTVEGGGRVAGPDGQHQALGQVRAPARAHLEQRAWDAGHRALLEAPEPLDPAERLWLALSAYLLGRDDDCLRHLEEAHHRLAMDGEVAWAARATFWLAWMLFDRGDVAQAAGWVARGLRLLDDQGLDTVERAYLATLEAVRLLYAGETAEAERCFGAVVDEARRFGETDLLTIGRLGLGEARLQRGAVDEGIPLLDEAMVTVMAGEVTAVVAGLVYCAVIEACQQTYDLRRAQEWTTALTEWCDAQPDLVPYRGHCQVHRVEVLRMHGAWQDAMTEAVEARRRLSAVPGHPAVGAAVYQEAELYRLRGQLQRAEQAYLEAGGYGHDPQPGLARLRLAQGDVAAAAAGLRRALDEGDPATRPRLLSAAVEVALAAGDAATARDHARELAALAAGAHVPLLQAVAAQAAAEVALAAGEPGDALREARRAWTMWNDFGAPYEAARARVLVGRACRELGDVDGARSELDAARRGFRHLGAHVDLAALDGTPAGGDGGRPGPLTDREVEVLRLVAEGRTNRSVADALHLSEKTVARHLSNIYTKLGLSSRAAATAWAYEHDLVRPHRATGRPT